MNRLFSNRQLILLSVILMVSILSITGVSLYITYNKTISSSKVNLTNLAERQKSMIQLLLEQGKNEQEIIQFLKALHQEQYRLGETGESVIARKNGDSTEFVYTYSDFSGKIKIGNPEGIALPMQLALSGKSGIGEAYDYRKRKVLAAYTYIPSLHWGLVAKITTAEINRHYYKAIIIVVIIAILFMLLDVFLFIKICRQPIQNFMKKEDFYQNLFSNKYVCKLIIDPANGNIVDANPAACNFYGYEHKKFISMNISQINTLPPNEIMEKFNQIKSEKGSHFIFKHKLADGSIRDVEVSSSLVNIKNKNLIYSINFDITARIQTELQLKIKSNKLEAQNEEYQQLNEELTQTNTELHLAKEKAEESEKLYRLISENLSDVVWMLDLNFNYLYLSPSTSKLFGYTLEERKNLTTDKIFPPEEFEKLKKLVSEHVQKYITHGENNAIIFPTEGIHKNGSPVYLEVSANFVVDENNNIIGIQGVSRDMSERRKHEMELLAAKEKAEINEQKLKEAQELAKIGNWELDFIQNKLYWSDEVYRIFGLTPQEFVATYEAFLSYIHPEDRESVNASYTNHINLKQPYNIVHRILLPNNEIKYVRERCKTEFDNDGKPMYSMGTVADITESITIQNELIAAKEKAEESDRLKTAFLHNISHEIRTPMNAIMGFSSLLEEHFNDKSKLKNDADIIKQRSNYLLEIIDDILDIAKIESGQLTVKKETFSMNDFFAELTFSFIEYQKQTSKQNINLTLQVHCDSTENLIIADRIKLKQIFTNLLTNAFKYTDNGKIEGGCKFDANHNLLFYVSDTGIGIPSDKQELIFERFVQLTRTEKLVGGTGLGLSIAKGLVELLNGKIWLESEPGKGTTFYFSFPCECNPSEKKEQTKTIETQEYDFHGKTILVVEDDFYNAIYIKEILSGTGLNILHTEFGKEAVKMATSQPFDLVLMDIRLPDISGYEAIRQIKEQKPETKIIAQTGYAGDDDRQKAMDAGCCDYISKPINRALLLSIINNQWSQK